jgi:hypothetical protein
MEFRMRLLTILTLIFVVGTVTDPADAARRKGVRALQPAVKDCTPLNGRFGYYGNPWCSRAEQQAWDRATARPLR